MRPLLVPPAEGLVEPGPIPTFSIVIPAYQASPFIGDAVRSALAQSVEPHEVIVCDDGSTDDLASALAPYRDRILFLQRPHAGVGAARNAAIEAATSDFVVLQDADDISEPSRLAALGELASARPDLDILATDLVLEEAGVVRGRFYDTLDFAVVEQRLAILESCFVACPALRTSSVRESGGFDESLAVAGDWDLFMRLIFRGAQAGLVPEPLLRYRRHLSTATADRARSLWARVTVLEKARQTETLTTDERAFLERCLARLRTRAQLNDATALAASRGRDARRLLLRLAVAGDTGTTTRLMAAAAALAPRPATAALAWQERRVARSRPRRPQAKAGLA
jgi:glycosyltransferase involved in cell wall biosynthesis